MEAKWEFTDNEININLPRCFNLMLLFHCNVLSQNGTSPRHPQSATEMGYGKSNAQEERIIARRIGAELPLPGHCGISPLNWMRISGLRLAILY